MALNAGGMAVSHVMVISFVITLSVSLLKPLREVASFQVTTLVIIRSMTLRNVNRDVM